MESVQVIIDALLFGLIVFTLWKSGIRLTTLEQTRLYDYNENRDLRNNLEAALGKRSDKMQEEIAYLKYPARYQLKDKVEITFRLVTGSFNGIIIARRDNYTRATYNYPASVAWIYEVYNPITEQTHDIPQEQIIQVLPKETKIC